MDQFETSPIKIKAVEDARQLQSKVNEQSLVESTRGNKDMRSAAVVAIKIIDIDESDTQNPRYADSCSDVLKEIGALSILSETKAKNINYVIEALVIGQSMWLVTEYCSGGSVATLMKPTFPAGLQEKWIIPILREVAEALSYVHAAGIIHRDIKCNISLITVIFPADNREGANVLITELGGVQLCDFGIAGIIESKVDKRSTIVGTPHWMAPELLTGSASYGKEIDIWAFGAMVFEIATGLPPNVANGIPYERLGTHLKQHVPRLEGGDYSTELCDLVAYCLEEDPKSRPVIEEVQKHPYIFNTASEYPTSSLRALVASFKIWESRGGSRKSLFMQHGAQRLSSDDSTSSYEWNFSTTEFFDQEILDEFSTRDVYDAYGSAVLGFNQDTAKPQRNVRPTRRRAPPDSLSRLPAHPLEKIFDPNTLSNYDDNSRAQYGGATVRQQQSDLPLRDNSAQIPIRDVLIDLGEHDAEMGSSSFTGLTTIRADRKTYIDEDEYSPTSDIGRITNTDLVDIKKNRRTQDWKFPTLPISSDVSRFPLADENKIHSASASGNSKRPSLIYRTTEPIGIHGGSLKSEIEADRFSIQSLIDLDMSLPDPIRDFSRPSTAMSEVNSTPGEQMPTMNPFELERHQSVYHQKKEREPSLYVNDDEIISTSQTHPRQDQDKAPEMSASNPDGSETQVQMQTQMQCSHNEDTIDDMKPHEEPPPPLSPFNMRYIPDHPSRSSLIGTASAEEMKAEFSRILQEMTQKLDAFRDCYNAIKAPISATPDESPSPGLAKETGRRSFTE
ncbi:hypothetical protein Golomagni_01596 [Golovinomyces magnicellulatus]|nr:hypothetical protein Golomagni_01596 [Golovinomyces magnicellulatus]